MTSTQWSYIAGDKQEYHNIKQMLFNGEHIFIRDRNNYFLGHLIIDELDIIQLYTESEKVNYVD